MRGWWGLFVGLVFLSATPVGAASVSYVVDAELDPHTRTIVGTVEIHGAEQRDEWALMLYPNRFAVDDPGVDDLTRRFVYPHEEFVSGGMTIDRVVVRGARDNAAEVVVDDLAHDAIGDWPSTLLRVRAPVEYVATPDAVVVVSFHTLLPERFGTFGVADESMTALAGWFPLLTVSDDDLPPGVMALPVSSSTTGRLRVPRTMTSMVGALVVAADTGPSAGCAEDATDPSHRTICFQSDRHVGPSILSAPDYRVATRTLGSTEVVYLERPSRFAYAVPPAPARSDLVLDTVGRILAAWPANLPAAPARLVVAEAPLRLALRAPGMAGVAIVSDRILRVHRVLRHLHERELATAVYAAAFAGIIAAREAPADASWVTAGLAATLANRHLDETQPDRWSVDDWINALNVFAVVDRFETAPQVPFGRSFFPQATDIDALGDGIESFARSRPSGGTIFQKLANIVGDDAVGAIRSRYLSGDESFVVSAEAVHGAPLAGLLAQWTAPYPQINYRVQRVDRGTDDAPTRVHVVRDSARAVREPVDVELVGAADERVRLVWDDDRREAVFDVEAPSRVRSVRIDPERKLLEETLVDNASPRPWQIVVGGADATVTSSQFGLATLFVARKRYDYSKDIGLTGFVSSRGAGVEIGPRWHFGRPLDANRYRHNLVAFYRANWLRGDFTDDSRPGLRTDGRLGGLGFRYDYSDERVTRNPTSSLKLRLFGTWYQDAFGSTFDYLEGGVRASIVRPLLTHRTLIAGHVLNAFSTPIDGDRIPLQGQFSLGGNRGVRGIPVDEELGENIMLVRGEVRQRLYPDIDWSFFDLLVLRHHQVRLFVDAGHVENRRSSLYRVSDFAVGAGIGLAAVYDFMGFHPGIFYLEIARRLDHASGQTNAVQVLFGTRQAF